MPFGKEDYPGKEKAQAAAKGEKKVEKKDAGQMASESHEKNLEARKDRGFQFEDKDKEEEKK